MPVLTQEFLANRRGLNRYKRFILPAVIVLVVAGFAATGFWLYGRSEKKGTQTAKASSDLLPSSWLVKYFGTDSENDPKVGGPFGDPDNDFLNNRQEFYFNTDPTKADTDGDGAYDAAEIATNSNPTGEGELYSAQYAQSVADKFIEEYGLDELKEENIQKQVLGILNPPDPNNIEIPLPDPSTLKLNTDDSPEAVDRYLQEANTAGVGLGDGLEQLKGVLENPYSTNAAVVLGRTYETIDKLRNLAVPVPFSNFHQLHIAGLFAAAKIMEVSQTIDQSADMVTQQDKIAQQYYQVEVIQKIDDALQAETERLKDRYKEVLEKYIQQ